MVLNNNFYIQPPLYDEEMFDFFENPEMKINLNNSLEKVEVNEPKVEMADVSDKVVSETESVISTEASGPIIVTMPFVIPMQSIYTLDAQLDFIMETTKKYQKPREKYQKRNRKTSKQLKILIDELGNEQNASKSQIKEVATKTGLTELQVYKWYWDRKAKSN
jgi:hypothetical protein